MREDTNIKGADTEPDFWLIIYSVPGSTQCNAKFMTCEINDYCGYAHAHMV